MVSWCVPCPLSEQFQFQRGLPWLILGPDRWLGKQWRDTATSTDSRQVSKFQSMSAVYIAIRWQRVPEDWTLCTMVSFQVCMSGVGSRTNHKRYPLYIQLEDSVLFDYQQKSIQSPRTLCLLTILHLFESCLPQSFRAAGRLLVQFSDWN